MNATKTLIDFAVSTRYKDLPAQVVGKGKERILDTMACILAAGREEIASIMVGYVKAAGCKQEASIIGFHEKTIPQLAALANGTIAHALDFDDCQPSFNGHPSVVILPATLAVAEQLHASGEAALEAFMVGFEVACKIGKGVNPDLFERGWHATSVIGVLGAAVAAGKLFGLDAREMRFALALAGSQASGLKGNFGTMAKPFHAGKAAEGGVMAALLAKNGFTASPNILDVKNGFCDMFSRQYDLAAIIEGLGNPFDIVSPGVITKTYPSCLCAQPVVEATRYLINAHRLCASEIDSVECLITPLARDSLIYDRPQTGLEAKFSAAYAVAVAFLNDEISPQQFTDEVIQDHKSQELIEKVNIVVDPEIESTTGEWLGLTSRVTVKSKEGKDYTKMVAISDAGDLASLNMIVNKYKGCAMSVLDQAAIERSIEAIFRIEELDDVGRLLSTITPQA
jgi:2-methylcitrate dehydratase PrpD